MNDALITAYQKEQAERVRRLPLLQAALLARLARAKVDLVEIPYDGEGDNGQIEGVHAYDGDGAPVVLGSNAMRLALQPDEPALRFNSLSAALEDFAWQLLGQYHAGFENDGGGYGQIIFRVPRASVTIDHNDRFTDVVNCVTEV